jgi:hypothetical protein
MEKVRVKKNRHCYCGFAWCTLVALLLLGLSLGIYWTTQVQGGGLYQPRKPVYNGISSSSNEINEDPPPGIPAPPPFAHPAKAILIDNNNRNKVMTRKWERRPIAFSQLTPKGESYFGSQKSLPVYHAPPAYPAAITDKSVPAVVVPAVPKTEAIKKSFTKRELDDNLSDTVDEFGKKGMVMEYNDLSRYEYENC